MTLLEFLTATLKRHGTPGTPPPRWKAEAAMAIALWVGRDALRRIAKKNDTASS